MNSLEKFLKHVIGSQIFIFGLGKSGLSVLKFLLDFDIKIFAFDQSFDEETVCKKFSIRKMDRLFINPNLKIIDENFSRNCNPGLKSDNFFILSPGIHFEKTDHFMIDFVSQNKLKVICDIEFFILLSRAYFDNQNFLNNSKIIKPYFIGITGTNGKSTVSALVNYVLKENSFHSFIGGNFGIPIFDLYKIFDERNNDNKIYEKIFYVIEVSSFQLDLMHEAIFDLGAIINITSDHLERYDFCENKYQASKEKLIKLSKKIILGLNDQKCLEFFAKYFLINGSDRGGYNNEEYFRKKFFGAYYVPYDFNFDFLESEENDSKDLLNNIESLMDEQSFVFNLRNNLISFDSKNLGVDSIQNANLKGDHNLQNLIIAYGLCYIAMEKDSESHHKMIVEKLNSFDGLEHRMQLIAKYKNIYFINDSKATSAYACRVSLKCFDNVFLILGGIQKVDGIEPILQYFQHVKKIYLIGKAQESFAHILEDNGFSRDFYKKCDTLEVAVKSAFDDALKEFRKFEDLYLEGNLDNYLPELNILLSPACASFDQFENFEDRGQKFIEIVRGILNEVINNA